MKKVVLPIDVELTRKKIEKIKFFYPLIILELLATIKLTSTYVQDNTSFKIKIISHNIILAQALKFLDPCIHTYKLCIYVNKLYTGRHPSINL